MAFEVQDRPVIIDDIDNINELFHDAASLPGKVVIPRIPDPPQTSGLVVQISVTADTDFRLKGNHPFTVAISRIFFYNLHPMCPAPLPGSVTKITLITRFIDCVIRIPP